jgi:hypothetical protein
MKTKVVGVLFGAAVLCFGLFMTAMADEVGGARVEGKTIEGQLLQIEYDIYVVKAKDGKEVRLHTDKTTQMGGQLRKGDQIEAKVTERNQENHALSIRSIP